MIIDGKALVQCFEVVAKCGCELVALSTLLKNMLIKNIGMTKNTFSFVPADKFIEKYRCSAITDWVVTDNAFSLPLKNRDKRKKTVERYLGFQISMAGDGIALPGQDAEPLLHIFCWDAPVEFDENYIGFPLESDEPFEVIDNRLLLWGTSDNRQWNNCTWTYSLKLVQLNTIDDLQKNVINPVLALLSGADVVQSLPDSLLALVYYRSKETLLLD